MVYFGNCIPNDCVDDQRDMVQFYQCFISIEVINCIWKSQINWFAW